MTATASPPKAQELLDPDQPSEPDEPPGDDSDESDNPAVVPA